ncbi:MAG TPA: aspartate/glutamate racemase family protein [Steroidobacteraceae bacterium]|jgi:allantoin racemase|nr:aspartate/glutamate racemase family protein [Steroidobacteraceae bacterium]
MKICIVHVNAEEVSAPYTQRIVQTFSAAKRDDTELVHRYVRRLKRATDTVFAYPILLNKVDVVDCLLDAALAGVDGAMVACSGDPGVTEARSILSIPVVGPMEASLHLACTYAYKIGIVTVADPSWAEYCHMMVRSCGLMDRLAGIARIEIPSKDAFSRGFVEPESVLREISAKARSLVDLGAGAIVIGSAGLSVIAGAARLSAVPGLGVPIFDCLTTGLKCCELRIDMSRKLGIPEIGRAGFTERLEPKDVDRLRKLFRGADT